MTSSTTRSGASLASVKGRARRTTAFSVRRRRPVESARANHEGPRSGALRQILARELRYAVDGKRMRRTVFRVWSGRCAVENVIGADRHKDRAAIARVSSGCSDRQRIDLEGALAVRLHSGRRREKRPRLPVRRAELAQSPRGAARFAQCRAPRSSGRRSRNLSTAAESPFRVGLNHQSKEPASHRRPPAVGISLQNQRNRNGERGRAIAEDQDLNDRRKRRVDGHDRRERAERAD